MATGGFARHRHPARSRTYRVQTEPVVRRRTVPARARRGSTELLGQSDDDALGATHEAEPVAVLVLRDLADELGTVGAQAGDDVVELVDGEHDAADAQRVRRRVLRLGR